MARLTMGDAGAGPDNVERIMLGLVRIGIALTALTPLVVTETTLFPFIVGKAVYSRSLIALVFALWAVLAVLRPAWRPRFCWVTALAAGCLGAAVLAAVFGSSLQRSLWSDYERMGGVVDLAHWTALLFVLVATTRTRGDMLKLIAPHIAVGTVIALLVSVRHAGIMLPWFGTLPERGDTQYVTTFGNAIFLGAYLQTVALLAGGLLARSLVRPRPGGRAAALWRACHAVVFGATCWAITLSGSFGAVLGFGAGVAVAALLACMLASPPRRVLFAWLLAATGAGAAGVVGLGFYLVTSPTIADTVDTRTDNLTIPLFRRLSVDGGRHIQHSLVTRVENWEAGTAAFADRPLLGWGPENYVVASARHAPADSRFPSGIDRAHSMLVEHAATTGAVGLAAYLALWGCAFGVIVRAARAAAPPERALVLFAGAAVVGLFVQCQTAFFTSTVSLMATLLLAFAARARVFATAQPVAGDGPPAAPSGALLHAVARCAVAVAAVGLAGTSLATNRAIFGAASAILDAETSGQFWADLERGLRTFEPLGNTPRLVVFLNVAENWSGLRSQHPAEAARLLRWVHAESRPALTSEPDNLRIHDALARVARAATPDEPGLAGAARHHQARVYELAPRLRKGARRPTSTDETLSATPASGAGTEG